MYDRIPLLYINLINAFSEQIHSTNYFFQLWLLFEYSTNGSDANAGIHNRLEDADHVFTKLLKKKWSSEESYETLFSFFVGNKNKSMHSACCLAITGKRNLSSLSTDKQKDVTVFWIQEINYLSGTFEKHSTKVTFPHRPVDVHGLVGTKLFQAAGSIQSIRMQNSHTHHPKLGMRETLSQPWIKTEWLLVVQYPS